MSEISQIGSPHALFKASGQGSDTATARPRSPSAARTSPLTCSLSRGHTGFDCPSSPSPSAAAPETLLPQASTWPPPLPATSLLECHHLTNFRDLTSRLQPPHFSVLSSLPLSDFNRLRVCLVVLTACYPLSKCIARGAGFCSLI